MLENVGIPPRCGSCPAAGYDIGEDGWAVMVCRFCRKERNLWEEREKGRPSWCPMRQIPAHHGGLIDRDEVVKDLDSLAMVSEWDRDMVRAMIYSKRLVVEPTDAEGDDEEC